MQDTTAEHPEQLTLLDPAAVPMRFRLGEATRRRGLAHIAAIRTQLERSRIERQATAGSGGRRRPPTPRAA